MRQSRRMFLGSLATGIAVFSLPEVSPVFRLLSPTMGLDEDLADTIHRLLLGESSGGPFVARAETRMFEGTPQPLLSANTALLKMLDEHGFSRSFSSRMNKDEAAQCESEFIAKENSWRQRGFDAFTKVNRSKVDDDVAFGVAGNIDPNSNLVRAVGATQHENKAAKPLEGPDAPLTIAMKWLLDENLSGKEVAQALTPTNKSEVAVGNNQVAFRYETPATSGVYIPQARPSSRVRNAVGVLAANLKREPNNVFFADVYS